MKYSERSAKSPHKEFGKIWHTNLTAHQKAPKQKEANSNRRSS